jgi:3-phenylpropionate/trans-cinnamate dioxygenase ferredoxin subunit
MMSQLVKITTMQAIEAQEGMCVEIKGKRICVFNLKGHLYAIEDKCSHEGGSLSDGIVEGQQVECPRHGTRFYIATGESCCALECPNVTRYNVTVRDGDVLVEV